MEIREQLLPGYIYHICTKAVGQEQIFRDGRDYNYFKRKMDERLTAAWEILAYALVPNEIHFVVRIVKKKIDGEIVNHSTLLSHLLNGYVQHYNHKHFREGSLLSRSFRRKSVHSENEIQELISKVHNLPVAKKLVGNRKDWLHSSYRNFVETRFDYKHVATLIAIFKSELNFQRIHSMEELILPEILPRRKWIKSLTPQEIAFREKHPLGVHRWARRSWEKPT